jgi:predicted ATPase/class 3 adenylate cyclase
LIVADALPRGSVTFVFTDIEGSTRLLRRLGSAYTDVLERHRRVLRSAFNAHGGVEVKTDADSCFVAFASTTDALTGCVAAQQAVATASWPDQGAPLVRMGVHTGLAFPHDDDYIALAVHQAARVVDAAHGGQVIASEHVVATVEPERLQAAGVELADLGHYRLRDFDAPVALYEVGPGGRPGPFPAVRAVPADHHNIVAACTSFVGRQSEVADIAGRLAPGRTVTIAGAGGMGKTRLATEIGLQVAPEWRDGVWLVDLSSVTEASLVVPSVASALGTPSSGPDRLADVVDDLGRRHALIILDNCEQLVEACSALVATITARCPSVAVLATSREPLGVPGEDVHRLKPLPVSEDAVDLFVDRFGAAGGMGADRSVVSRICERLDGMPLAIELAASRGSVLSAPEILAGLDERFRLLQSRDRTVPERQRTMTALLDWSRDLLTSAERAAFDRLSAFAGTFGLDAAAAAVAGSGIDAYDGPELVWSLVDKSLVVVEPAANATRYRMLETVRAYAAGHLERAGARVETSTRLGRWYVERFPLAQRGNPAWLSALAMEIDTIAALIDTIEPDGAIVPALARLRVEPRSVGGEPRLGCEEIDGVLGRISVPSPAVARLVLCSASLLGDAGQLDEAWRRCDEGEAMLDLTGEVDRWGSVRVTSPRATLLLRSGTPDGLQRAGDLARAQVTAATTDGDRADALLRLALVSSALGRDDVADLNDQVSTLARRAGDHVLVALALNNLAEAELRQGDVSRAAAHQREALDYAAELGMEHLTSFGLIVGARIAADQGSDERAARLHAFAEARLAESGLQLFPDDVALSDAMLERVAARLGAAAYDEARQSAAGLTTEQALAEADAVLAAAAGEAPVTA